MNFPAIFGPPLSADQIAIFYRTFEDAILIAKTVELY
jgi:hypothetical protein